MARTIRRDRTDDRSARASRRRDRHEAAIRDLQNRVHAAVAVVASVPRKAAV